VVAEIAEAVRVDQAVVISVVAEAVPVALTVQVAQVQAAAVTVRVEIAQAVRVRDNKLVRKSVKPGKSERSCN